MKLLIKTHIHLGFGKYCSIALWRVTNCETDELFTYNFANKVTTFLMFIET